MSLENPILNSPYEPPSKHFVFGSHGPTGETKDGRRPSQSFIPVPANKKAKETQQEFDLFETTHERIESNTLINDIRQRVELWRARDYPHVTPVSRKLLQHWADPKREERMLFCQREAAETAIYLAEVAGRHGEPDFRERITPENEEHNDGLPRVALKMATGTGKTVVMAMLIAWQVCNKAYKKADRRFSSRFLIVTPGITIRDRLRVLHPEDESNYYDLRGIVPDDLRHHLDDAAIVITNYHAFQPRTAKEMRGVATNTRRLLTAGKPEDPFLETDDQVVDRVLRDLRGRGNGEIVVFNDEAHHCYQDKPIGKVSRDDKDRNENARVWFRGLAAVDRRVGVKAVYDLSATPYYLGGSGYQEGFIFPWVVSDFSLLDAIESGIVKVPRVPVDDDVKNVDKPVYLNLWEHVGQDLRSGKQAGADPNWTPPSALQGALESLYRSYERRFAQWEQELKQHGEPPPVMIVVCPNTTVSKLVFDWIAGQEIELPSGDIQLRHGKLPLLSNVKDGEWILRAPTIIVDSAQLESGGAMKADFKKAVAAEIEVFKNEYRLRNQGADVDKLTDEDLLREVMNTVGKKGKLGEHVRCVVSVSMLTEGWDANTVTHILGIRAFASQLLCEQVVGRGLRRRSYEPNENGRFEPEYAEVYGVPFAFIPTDRDIPDPKPSSPAVEVVALPERWEYRIEFPKVDGYRIEMPEEAIEFDHEHTKPFEVNRELLALWVEVEGLVGKAAEIDTAVEVRNQELAFEIAAEVLRRHFLALDGAKKPWLFPALLDVTRRWLDDKVTFAPDTPSGVLLFAEYKAKAAEAVYESVIRYPGIRFGRLLPVYRRFDGSGSTDEVAFLTRKKTQPTVKSHVDQVVLDAVMGQAGNKWEARMADLLEANDDVAAYVKNDRLDFDIPYVHAGKSHRYVPDFLVRLVERDGDEFVRTLIVEVSGSMKSPGPTKAKADTARNQWCTAVNNDGAFGRWGYIEISKMEDAEERLADAIDALYADMPIIGEPEH